MIWRFLLFFFMINLLTWAQSKKCSFSQLNAMNQQLIAKNKIQSLIQKNLEFQKIKKTPSAQIKIASNLITLNFKLKQINELIQTMPCP